MARATTCAGAHAGTATTLETVIARVFASVEDAGAGTVDVLWLMLALCDERALHDDLRDRNVSPSRLRHMLIEDLRRRGSRIGGHFATAASDDLLTLLHRCAEVDGLDDWRGVEVRVLLSTLFDRAPDLREVRLVLSLCERARLDATPRRSRFTESSEPHAGDGLVSFAASGGLAGQDGQAGRGSHAGQGIHLVRGGQTMRDSQANWDEAVPRDSQVPAYVDLAREQARLIEQMADRLDRQDQVLREIVSYFSSLTKERSEPARQSHGVTDHAPALRGGRERSRAGRENGTTNAGGVSGHRGRRSGSTDQRGEATDRVAADAAKAKQNRSSGTVSFDAKFGSGGKMGLSASRSGRFSRSEWRRRALLGRDARARTERTISDREPRVEQTGRSRAGSARHSRKARSIAALWLRLRERNRSSNRVGGWTRTSRGMRFALRSRGNRLGQWLRRRGFRFCSAHRTRESRNDRRNERFREDRQEQAGAWHSVDPASSEGEKRFYLAVDDPVVDAPSIGPRTAERLEPAGIITVRDLLDADCEELAGRTDARHITAEVVREWQCQARLVCMIPWLRGTHAQLLIGAGYESIEDIVDADQQAICSDVLRFATSKAGQRLLRAGPPPELEKILAWISNAHEAEPERVAS
jgi:hypothetical protein